jgi:Xaa-Pro dipeptidase
LPTLTIGGEWNIILDKMVYWDKDTIKKHKDVSKLVEEIKDEAFDFIKKRKTNVTEWEVMRFIHKRYEEEELWTTDPQIVAFGSSGATPHYFPIKKNSKKLRKNKMILIDMWARRRGRGEPFTDMTWMGYFGKMSKGEREAVNLVFKARDKSLNFVKNRLKKGVFPVGREVDACAHDLIKGAGYGKYLKHTLGHSIGFMSPHGKPDGLNRKNKKRIVRNLGYTVEPGVYLPGKFGVRSEIDFYIDDRKKVVLTTGVQKKIIFV